MSLDGAHFLMSKDKLFNHALLTKCTERRSGNFHLNLVAIDDKSVTLSIWLENLASFVLRKAHVLAIHLALAGNFTYCHIYNLLILLKTCSVISYNPLFRKC